MKCSDLFTSSVKLLMGEVGRSAFGRSEGLDTDGRICAPFWGCVQWKHTSTHIATTGYMFYIIFGATPGLHTAQVQLLIENLHLESWYMGVKKTQLWRRKQRAANEDDYWRGRLDVGGTSLRLGGARADRNPREEMSPHRRSGASKPLQSGEAFQRFSNCTGATIKLDLWGPSHHRRWLQL